MEEAPLYYAAVEKLEKGTYMGRNDIGKDVRGNLYQIVQIEMDCEQLSQAVVQRYSVAMVQRILGARNGDLQWKVL